MSVAYDGVKRKGSIMVVKIAQVLVASVRPFVLGRLWRRNSVISWHAALTLGLGLGLIVVFAPVLAGCGSDQDSSTSLGATTTASIEITTTLGVTSTTMASLDTSSSVSELSTTTTEGLSSAETLLANGNIRAMGYIERVWEEGGARYISIDYAEMLTGEAARAAAIEAGEIGPEDDLPNDYYIRNTNPATREFTVAKSASITTVTRAGANPDEPQPATWSDFMSFFGDSPPAGVEYLHLVPWWIERDGAEVISIEEQYLP